MAKSKTLQLTIYGDIGENWWTGEGITPASVKKEIDAAGEFERVSVRINSPGGSVFDGVGIYNLLRSQQKPVDVMVDGIAASAASIVAMAGDARTMGKGAMLMVHNPWSLAMGNADELRKQADALDKVADSMMDIYVARSGRAKDEVRALLDAETWMSADESVAQGFATAVAESDPAAQAAARAFPMLAKFKNVPEKLTKCSEPEQRNGQAAQSGPPAAGLTVIRERFELERLV